MFDAIIAFSLRHRALILMMTMVLIIGGVVAFSRLPIDAVPDVTNNQVQILTKAPALSALEVERFVTFPIEIALKSLPNTVELRSSSQPGLSVVTIVFEESVDIYFARQQVLEKLREAEEEIPEGVERPELSPVSTGLGEIFRYVIRDTTGRLSPMELRTVQDWIVRRQLLGTPGVAEVNSLGGQVKQYQVLVDPAALVGYGVTLREVFEAVSRSSGNAGGAYIESGPERYSVRSVALATSVDDLRNTVIRTTSTGTPITVGDVAAVEIGSAIRFGSASQDGKGEVVTGIAMQLKGANARVVVNAVKDRIEEIRPSLPPGVVIDPYYDREELVDRTIQTVLTNLIEGALLVIGVLLLFLVNLRAGLILASVIPLAMMFAGILMLLTGQSGNLMSLGAIDFGLVVDGSLIIVENVLRLLEERYRRSGGVPLTDLEMRRLVFTGSVEVRKAAQFGEIIIIVVYLPILTLQGIEGKLFKPMALTVAYALVGAVIFSITYVPAMCSLLMKKKGKIRHSPIIAFLHKYYRPLLERALSHRYAIAGTTIALLAASVFVFTRLGGEFIPRLDEGDISMSIIRLPSVSLTESQKLTDRVEREIMKFPEVRTVVTSTGRAEISTDPMGVEVGDAFVMLKPRDEWETGRTKAELIEAMSEKMEKVAGVGVAFLQPIEMRVNELISGVRADLAVKITGEDYDVLNPSAQQIATILRSTQGSADVAMEQTTGLAQLLIQPDRAAIARYGLTVGDVNEVITTAVGGAQAAEVAEGERRFAVVVRAKPEARQSVEAIRGLLVATPGGQRVPLSSLATVTVQEGPARISREEGSRFITVQANVRGRDIQSFVEEVQKKVTAQVKLPAGYNVHYGGQFENLQAAGDRLLYVVPIAMGLIFLLLFQTFRSGRLGVLIFLCVPMAIIGGVAALAIAGMPFSISAGVGFIALFGIAVLNGIVMVAAIRKHQAAGRTRRESVLTGADERLRPVLTTAALAAFGFIPMLLAHGAGAEVQRPLATVIIGGLISSTFLTLFVLPIIYDWFGGTYVQLREEDFLEIVEEAETALAPNDSAQSNGGARGPASAALGVLLLFLFGTMVSWAQTSMTLETARQRAASVSPELRRGQASLAASRSGRAATGILPNPEVFFTVDEAPSAGLTGRSNTALGVSQTISYPGLYGAQGRAADILIRQAEAEQQAIVRESDHRVSLAYTDLLGAQAAFELADSAVAVAAEFSRLTDRRRELGETHALEALQASVALANAERRRTLARGDLLAAQAELRTLIAAAPDEQIQPAERLTFRPITLALVGIEERFGAKHPRLRAAALAVDAARAREDVVGYEKFPDITFEYSRQTVDGRGGFYGGGIRLGVPLWRWFSDGPDRLARAETAMREAELAAEERSLLSFLRLRYASYETARRAVEEYSDKLVPRSLEAYRIALKLFGSGDATYLEVLAAQNGLVETQAAYIEAIRGAERYIVELEYIVGEELR